VSEGKFPARTDLFRPVASDPTRSTATARGRLLAAAGAVKLSLWWVVVSFGCADPNVPSRPLVPYDAHEQTLFDDAIDPTAVGLVVDDPSPNPQVDRVLRERVQVGDGVVRGRVRTVTMKKDERGGHDLRFELALHVTETLAGHVPEDVNVRLSRTSPSAAIVESMGAQLADKTFVVFLRAFADPNGKPRFYAHFSADSKDVVAAVKAASAGS
jgi:hypothetical protein